MSEPTQIQAWLQGFPKDEIEARVRELDAELASLREALAMYHRLSGPPANGSAPGKGATSEPRTRRDRIRRVLRDNGNRPMSSGEIKGTMLERGWLTEDEINGFYAAMSTMTNRGGHLLRLQDGRYVLPPDQIGGNVA
jgi:hypothetical protein